MDEARMREIRRQVEVGRSLPGADRYALDTLDALAIEVTRLRGTLRAIADYSTAYHQPVLDDVRKIAREALAFTGDDAS